MPKNKEMNKKIIIIGVVIFLSLLNISFGEPVSYTVERTIDWSHGILGIKIIKENNQPVQLTPDYKYLVEREIRDQLPDIFLDSVLDIYVDSRYRIRDLVVHKARDIQFLKTLYIYGKNQGAYQSRDLKQIFIHYTFPFFTDKGIVPLFVHHEYPVSLKREIGFIPSMEYTGLIIYAKGLYGSYGTSDRVYVEPCLFPVFYDEETNPVLNKWMCDPEYLKKWGMAAYTESNDETAFLDRIGLFPLRTMAHQVFGKHHSDILLPGDVVKKLLSNKANRSMLQQGRILIIIEPEERRAPSSGTIRITRNNE
jgi:hypothetical protein